MAKGTVIVNLAKNWFGPDGSQYETRNNPHEFPAAWADDPPKDAPKDQKYAVLPSTATIVEGGRVVDVYRRQADGRAVLEPAVVEDDVKSVGNTVDDTSKGPDDLNEAHQSSTVAEAAKSASSTQLGGRPGSPNTKK